MVYRTEPVKMGLIIRISPDRKHGNGAVGGGRKNTSGKKATISQNGCDDVIVTGTTAKDLLKNVRKQFSIPPNVQINAKGITSI